MKAAFTDRIKLRLAVTSSRRSTTGCVLPRREPPKQDHGTRAVSRMSCAAELDPRTYARTKHEWVVKVDDGKKQRVWDLLFGGVAD